MKTKAVLTTLAMAMLIGGLHAKPLNKQPYLAPIADRFTFAVPMKKAPVIDGKLEKEVWGNIPRAKYFRVKSQLTNSVTKHTSFQIGYDKKYLYIAATMWESEPSQIVEGYNVQDGWPAHTDRINFIFSHEYNRKGTWQDSPYIFLMFAAGGIHRGFYNELPGKVERPIVDETREWISAYSKDKTRWYLETRIPLAILKITPETKQIYFNVRRDLMGEPKAEASTMWNPIADPKLDAHSFGILYFYPGSPKRAGLEERINGRAKYAYQDGILKVLANRKGEYTAAKQMYGSQPGWGEAEQVIDKLKACYDAEFKKNPWTISDELDDYFMEWKHVLKKLEKSSPTTPFNVKTKDAKILSVKLNGITLKPGKDSYDFSLTSGINELEITAEAAGKTPGVQFNLKGSPETSADFLAGAPDAKADTFKKADAKDGWLWSGDKKKVVFRQSLIWSRYYGNHPYAFIGPLVKEWGVSPGETMLFLHYMSNPKKDGKCKYQLIAEIPEGFTRINDHSKATNYRHHPTKDIKTEKVTIDGKKYIRYTYTWNLPEKLYKNFPCYFHYMSFRNDGYKFKKGEKVDFRFRRLVNGHTTDIVNVIKVVGLPPINGRKLSKIIFPQYDTFMEAPVSNEQLQGMVVDAEKAGLNDFMMAQLYDFQLRDKRAVENRKIRRALFTKHGNHNLNSPLFGIPLWGAGRGTNLHKLVAAHPDLQAKYYNGSGPLAPNWHNEFCLTNATGKYRKQFKEALQKDFANIFADGLGKDMFYNDENYPHGDKANWQHSYCYCDVCKADFRAMFNIPASEKIADEDLSSKYAAQWAKWWKRKHKKELLGLVYTTLKEMGSNILYYHNTHDTEAYVESKGLYDVVSVPIPGQSYVGGSNQARMDSQKRLGEQITGRHQSVGQFHTYFPSFRKGTITLYSSDNYFFHPKEQKMTLVRETATTHKGGFLECASFFSAGALYYAGEATRMIAAFEDLFHDGVRADNLATSDVFKYPNLLVLKKGDERLVLIFNESQDKPLTGTLRNLKLKPGQTGTVWESGKPYGNANAMKITVQPQDVVAVHIK